MVTYKQVVLLEFKGLPTFVLLVNPLVKGRRGKKKKAELNKAIDTWLSGEESGRVGGAASGAGIMQLFCSLLD